MIWAVRQKSYPGHEDAGAEVTPDPSTHCDTVNPMRTADLEDYRA